MTIERTRALLSLYAQSVCDAHTHSIVANNFYDPVFNESFSIRHSSDAKWWGGEPIWNVAERANVRCGCAFWPGSEVAVGGRRPTHFLKYNRSMPYEERVARLLEFVDAGDRFVSLYFEGVDSAGHEFGVSSVDALQKLEVIERRQRFAYHYCYYYFCLAFFVAPESLTNYSFQQNRLVGATTR